jgi:uncharacterized membrane protein YsdA (DUF1294 family)
LVSVVAIAAALGDKRAARLDTRRMPERTLLRIAALGGAVAMLLAMLAVRHKTRRAKFMVGLPAIIVLQFAAAAAVLWWRART